MFDCITDELFCPFCGEKSHVGDYQTKDLACGLDYWTIKDIIKFGDNIGEVRIYHRCRKCEKWIEIILDIERERQNFQKIYKEELPKI